MLPDLLSAAYLICFVLSGLAVARLVFAGERPLVRVWLGCVAALVMLLWFPALWAFCIGGGICTIGEALRQAYLLAGADAVTAGTLTSCTLIAFSALLTALGWYQKLALWAGAGSLVPITGFANAVVSAAIEFRPEGCVTGTGAKMFTIAGPVIVYGTLASAVYGLALWVSTLL